MDRLRCGKADAIAGTLFAIIAFFLVPFLIYLYIRRRKRRNARKNRHEEDGMELARGGTDGHPGPQTDRGGLDGVLNTDFANNTSQESVTLIKEHKDRGFDSSPGQSPPAYGTAKLGQTLQDQKVAEVPPSLASSSKDSEPKFSNSNVAGYSNGNLHGDSKWHSSQEEGRAYVDNSAEYEDRHEEALRRSRSSSRRSSFHGSEHKNGEDYRPDDVGSRCSSRRSTSPSAYQPDNVIDTPDEATSSPDEATLGPDEATSGPDEATSGPDEATSGPDEATSYPRDEDACVTADSEARSLH